MSSLILLFAASSKFSTRECPFTPIQKYLHVMADLFDISRRLKSATLWRSYTQARFRRHSTHVLNLTDELSTAKEWCLNQFATAVLVRYGKSVWCGKSSTGSVVVELNLCSTHGVPSESDIAPVSLQSRTYSVRFGTGKVRRLNQAWLVPPHQGRTYKHKHNMVLQVTQA